MLRLAMSAANLRAEQTRTTLGSAFTRLGLISINLPRHNFEITIWHLSFLTCGGAATRMSSSLREKTFVFTRWLIVLLCLPTMLCLRVAFPRWNATRDLQFWANKQQTANKPDCEGWCNPGRCRVLRTPNEHWEENVADQVVVLQGHLLLLPSEGRRDSFRWNHGAELALLFVFQICRFTNLAGIDWSVFPFFVCRRWWVDQSEIILANQPRSIMKRYYHLQ